MNDQQLALLTAMDETYLHWRVELSHEEAVAFLRTREGQNGYTTADLLELFDFVDRRLPRMWFPALDLNIGRLSYTQHNPNNGGRLHRWDVGREYTRVLYLHVTKLYISDGHYRPPEILPPAGTRIVDGLTAMCEAAGTLTACDELDVVENNNYLFTFRFWWD